MLFIGEEVPETIFLNSKLVKQACMEPEVHLLLLENTEDWCWSMLKETRKMESLSWDHSILPKLLGWGRCDCFLWTICGHWKRKREREKVHHHGVILGPIQQNDLKRQRTPNSRKKKKKLYIHRAWGRSSNDHPVLLWMRLTHGNNILNATLRLCFEWQ